MQPGEKRRKMGTPRHPANLDYIPVIIAELMDTAELHTDDDEEYGFCNGRLFVLARGYYPCAPSSLSVIDALSYQTLILSGRRNASPSPICLRTDSSWISEDELSLLFSSVCRRHQ